MIIKAPLTISMETTDNVTNDEKHTHSIEHYRQSIVDNA